MDTTIVNIGATLAAKVTFASHQNSVPILRELKIENTGDEPLNDVVVTIEADPAVLTPHRWPIDRIAGHSTVEVRELDVSLNAGLLLELHEAIKATVTIRVLKNDVELACRTHPLEALAQTEWGGATMPELLAAFVMPNDPAVGTVLKDAAQVLLLAGKSDTLNGYADGSASRVWEVTSAVWSAVTGRRLTYALPPSSFETQGQKIRPPSAILSGGLATCLDTACLFAAALEQAGLNAIIVLAKGHAFAGVWLQPEPFSDILTDEAATLRKRVKLQELVLFETTLAMQKPAPAFSVAVEAADRQIAEDKESDFIQALDVRRARMQRLRPLALRLQADGASEMHDAGLRIADGLEEAPQLPNFARPQADPVIETSADRLRFWRRKLLDLTAKNRLLNVTPSKTALQLVCPDPAALEDRLAGGGKIKITATPALDSGGRDAELHARRTGEELLGVYAQDALGRDEVLSPLSEKELQAALIELYRKARLDLQEGGANTLYLAVGFLSWKREPDDTRSFRAPLVLIPVTLERKTARSDVRMMAHDDKARFNGTLLEMLRQDFELRDLDGLEQELPQDDSGIDVSAVLSAVRRAVRDMRGFEVVEEVMLGTFSFAKYLMWKDLTDRAAQLTENRVVKHLLETPRDPFPSDADIPKPEMLDTLVDPGALFTPLPADSSQLAAVVASARGCDFVLDGPPGTGKSQTIANIIAHNLALGRKVLFVAEKMAALNVVYSRLEAKGLGAFCLELHSNKANKAEVVRQLGRAWDTLEETPTEIWGRDSERLKALRDELNMVVKLLHQPRAGGLSLHQAIGRVVRDGGPETPAFSWPSDQGPDESKLALMRDIARRLDINAANITSLDRSTFAWIGGDDWSPAWQSAVLSTAQDLGQTVRELEDALSVVCASLKLTVEVDPETLSALEYLAKALCASHDLDLAFAFAPDGGGVYNAARTALAHLQTYRSKEAELSTPYALEACRTIPIDLLKAQWEGAARKIWPFSVLGKRSVRKALASAGRCAATPEPAKDLPLLADMLAELSALGTLERQASRVSGWVGLDTKSEVVQRTLAIAAALQSATARLANSPEQLVVAKGAVRSVCVEGNELLAEGLPLRRALERYRRALSTHFAALARFRTAAKTPADLGAAATLSDIRATMDDILATRTAINAWCGWVRAKGQAVDLELLPLVNAVQSGTVGAAGTAEAFEVGYALWLANEVLEREPILRRFLPAEHDAKIADFRKLDDELAALSSQAIRAMLSGKIPRKDDKRLPRGYGALKYQLGLKAPRKALRELAAEMGETLTTLTPCLLMSPLSVAQYLPADTALFDLVIFDEASQITPWDAIGAIARGKQVIVAGDPKQMPPTNFFNRGTGNTEDGADGSDEEDQESVLEQCLAANLPHHRLTWHYRSRHESLIAFSNQRYYDGELITFPAAITRESAVSFVKVEGLYAKGKTRTNAEEARVMVAEVVRRLRDPSFVTETGRRQSVGVITLNSEQQKLVEDLLDMERRRNPDIEPFFDETLAEPVIVKNLETIQGDERDLVLLGVGYGPDVPGAKDMSMNFGPLNKDGGWRRWNVAVTRARREMILFTSFSSGMIDINRSRARAVKDLRDYQEFAIRGPSALAQADHGSLGSYESPFEQAVARGLRDKGWEVTTQIGVSRFRIDLGVIHPDRPGDYLSGVECDGASYHSAATARDRDKVREFILRDLGWDLVRVWSTDWWHDRAGALAKLDHRLRAMLDDSRRNTVTKAEAASALPEAIEAAHMATDLRALDSAFVPPVFPNSSEVTQPALPQFARDAGTVRLPEAGLLSEPAPEFRRTDLSRFSSVLRPDLFYEACYDPVLLELTAHIVKVEAPLRDDVLVERIARAHGFMRSGRLIRERVLKLKGRSFLRWADTAGGMFVWSSKLAREEWTAFRAPASEDDIRSIEDICSEELRAGAAAVLADDMAWELSRRLGIRRLSSSARERIEKALQT
jgi:very-short-patch-repair endonuclease